MNSFSEFVLLKRFSYFVHDLVVFFFTKFFDPNKLWWLKQWSDFELAVIFLQTISLYLPVKRKIFSCLMDIPSPRITHRAFGIALKKEMVVRRKSTCRTKEEYFMQTRTIATRRRSTTSPKRGNMCWWSPKNVKFNISTAASCTSIIVHPLQSVFSCTPSLTVLSSPHPGLSHYIIDQSSLW